MPRNKKNLADDPKIQEELEESQPEESEKEKLLKLHKTLTDLRINSISDLENLIARSN